MVMTWTVRLSALGAVFRDGPDDVALGDDAGDVAVSPTMMMAPIFFAASFCAISSSVASGRAVDTARPFDFKIAATFMNVSSRLPGRTRSASTVFYYSAEAIRMRWRAFSSGTL